MKKRIKPTYGLIGGTGNFGRFIRKTLSPWCSAVIWSRRLGEESFKRLLKEKIIVLSVPVHALESVLKSLKGFINKDVFLIDVSSVKTIPEKLIIKYFPENPFLSIHPLFGPESAKNGVKGLPVVVCKKSNHKTTVCILKMLSKKLKVKLINMTAREHDLQMAYVQGLSHFISAAFRNMNLPPLPLQTKSFGHLMKMHHILRKTSDDLFQTIQNANPYVKSIRRSFIKELFKIDKVLNRRKR